MGWKNIAETFLYFFYSILVEFMQCHVSVVLRQSFFSFQNNPKDLDPSCKTDLNLWDCLGRVKLVL